MKYTPKAPGAKFLENTGFTIQIIGIIAGTLVILGSLVNIQEGFLLTGAGVGIIVFSVLINAISKNIAQINQNIEELKSMKKFEIQKEEVEVWKD